MKLARRKFIHLAAGVVTLPAISWSARAQAYPSRPIAMVVPFPAGGPTDTIARILANRMKASLGQPIIIENVSGAGGSIGVGRVARAAPDGYTLSIGQVQSHAMNGAAYALTYDLLRDFEPVALLADTPQLLVGKNALPAKNVKELIAWMKANPGKATAGAVGIGGPTDLAVIYFEGQTSTSLQLVPYRGGAPLLQDLLAGQIDLTFGLAATYLAQVRAGQLKALAVLATKRWSALPEVPTMDEAGVPGFYASFWHGLWAPAGTPKDIVLRLNTAVVEALADPAVLARLNDLGQEIFPRDRQTPAALSAFQKIEIEKWWPIIKAAGIKAE